MQPKVKFKEWFETKLHVDRFPVPSEIRKSDFPIYINVSDEYIHVCHQVALEEGKYYYWFPMNETTGDMGLNSIYACMQIMYNAELENKKVFLHCHGGKNRSVTVRECYFFMRTGNFMEKENPRLINNIEKGRLPSIKEVERFLTNVQRALHIDETNRNNQLDVCKLKMTYDGN